MSKGANILIKCVCSLSEEMCAYCPTEELAAEVHRRGQNKHFEQPADVQPIVMKQSTENSSPQRELWSQYRARAALASPLRWKRGGIHFETSKRKRIASEQWMGGQGNHQSIKWRRIISKILSTEATCGINGTALVIHFKERTLENKPSDLFHQEGRQSKKLHFDE